MNTVAFKKTAQAFDDEYRSIQKDCSSIRRRLPQYSKRLLKYSTMNTTAFKKTAQVFDDEYYSIQKDCSSIEIYQKY